MPKLAKYCTPYIPVLAGLLLLAAWPAGAAMLWEDRLDGASIGTVAGGAFLPAPGGQGWAPVRRGAHPSVLLTSPDCIEYPLERGRNFTPETGTIRLKVQYRPTLGGTESRYWSSTLFDFLKEDGSTSILVYAEWKAASPGEKSRINVWGPRFRKDVYGFYIPLGFQVVPGQTVDLAFTWGPDARRDNHVYVNGRPVAAYYDNNAKVPAVRTGTLSGYLAPVNRLRLGIDSEKSMDYPGGRAPAVDTTFDLVQMYDRPMTPAELGMIPTIGSVSDDTFKVAGISGKLVAGDTVMAEMKAQAGGKASFDMGKVLGIAMEEVPPREGAPGIPAVDNGTYRGSYTIRPGDDYEDGYVVGHFVSMDNVAADNAASVSKWTIDTKPSVTFTVDRKDLPADSATKARIKLAAKDANGNPVKGRHYKLTLATTDEYTGTVGAGDFGKEVGASVETRWKGETDSWGEIEFDYTAGFAAKTVILSAKDLDSGGVSADYLTAYKEASIDIALTAPVSRAAARRGGLYTVKVEASRTELTADGRSRSTIRAKVLDPSGAAVPGDPVTFTLSSANGSLRVVKGTTDATGTAIADYVAGKKIGIVVVTATAGNRGASGTVSILLLSDAPAKIRLAARPATLPADGFSRSDIGVKVTDINDNPNKDTLVEFKVSRGGGKIEYPDRITDRDGDASNRYTAGTTPGVATIAATVRSRVPTEAELGKAKNVLFVPYVEGEDEVRIEKWLKRKGDAFVKGEPLVEYTAGRSRDVRTLAAPFDGTLGEVFVEYWDEAEVGQTLATVVPAAK